MGVLFLLECLCFFIVCLANGTAGLTLPLNQALDSPISLATVTTNLSGSTAGELCTSSLIWAGGTVYDTEFTNNCFQAWRTFLTTDNAMQRGVDYEFSQQGLAPSHPGLPSMATPRRYVKGESIVRLRTKCRADNALTRIMYNCDCQHRGYSEGDPAFRASRTVSALRCSEVS